MSDMVHDALARQALAQRPFPRVGDGLHTTINFLESYAQLAAVAMARAEFYGALLEQAYTDDGVDALIGHKLDVSVIGPAADQEVITTPTEEGPRGLVQLEQWERKEAARLIEKAVAMGVQLQQVEVIRTYAGTIANALTAVIGELGLTLDDQPVLRAAQRAGLAARRAMGHDDGDPDTHVGPRMSAVERVQTLRAALERAEREAGVVQAVTPGPA